MEKRMPILNRICFISVKLSFEERSFKLKYQINAKISKDKLSDFNIIYP